jgi:ribosomal protein S17E
MIKYYDLLRKKYEHNRKLLNDNRKSIEIIAKLTNEVDEVMEY